MRDLKKIIEQIIEIEPSLKEDLSPIVQKIPYTAPEILVNLWKMLVLILEHKVPDHPKILALVNGTEEVSPIVLRSLKDSWEHYCNSLGDVSYVQKMETKKAFYAGAFHIICEAKAIGDESITEDQGVQHLQSLEDECMTFVKSVFVSDSH